MYICQYLEQLFDQYLVYFQDNKRKRVFMDKLQSIMQEMARDIKNGTKDHSLLLQLNQNLSDFNIQSHIIKAFIQSIFSLYDLSNHTNLISFHSKKNNQTHTVFQYNILSISMKLTVFKMFSSLIIFFHENSNEEMPISIFKETLEIMILIARLFIDINRPQQIKNLYHLVKTFYDTINCKPSLDMEVTHYLNMIQLARFDIDQGNMDFYEFKQNLQKFYEKMKLGKNNEYKPYQQFVESIIFEMILKMAKKGKFQDIKMIKSFLSKEMAQGLSSILNFQDSLLTKKNNNIEISPYYELYLQIKKGKIDISQERLRSFIQVHQNFIDGRIFDVVSLTNFLLPLEIWIQIYINEKIKCPNISQAYRCFMFLVDKEFTLSPTKQGQNQSLIQKYHHQSQKISQYIKLSNLIILCLLLEKKQTTEPILSIIKRILKILIYTTLNIYPQASVIKEFVQKMHLVCSKFMLTDLTKMINIIWFYYQLILGIQTEDSYNKFIKNNLIDKNLDIFKNIKLIYQFKNNKMMMNNRQQVQKLKKIPFLAVLFQKKQNQSFILNIAINQFIKCQEKFQIYFMLFKKYCQEDSNCNKNELIKLIKHMQQTLIYLQFSKITKSDIKYIALIQKVLFKLISPQNHANLSTPIIKSLNILLLYIYSLHNFYQQILTLNTGILLNKYSKIIKMLSFVFDQLQKQTIQKEKHIDVYKYVNKTILCYTLEEYKIMASGKQEEITAEIGILNFYQLLSRFFMRYERQQKNIFFMKFIRFQILALLGQLSQNQIIFQKNVQLLKLFASSKWINKNIKITILKKIVKENMIVNKHQITLDQLNELIMLTQNNQEKSLYTQHLINIYGDQGKRYLMMKTSVNPQLYDFLTEKNNKEEDEY